MIEREELMTLPPRQRAVLDTIVQYHRTTLEPCPGAYIARRLRVHHRTVQEHLVSLHRKGWLRTPNAPAVPTRF